MIRGTVHTGLFVSMNSPLVCATRGEEANASDPTHLTTTFHQGQIPCLLPRCVYYRKLKISVVAILMVSPTRALFVRTDPDRCQRTHSPIPGHPGCQLVRLADVEQTIVLLAVRIGLPGPP